jgi:ANTAR domain
MHVHTSDSQVDCHRADTAISPASTGSVSTGSVVSAVSAGPEAAVAEALGHLAAVMYADQTPALPTATAPLLRALVPTVPGARWVSVTYRRRPEERASTPAASGVEAVTADSIQYQTGQGPCLEALSGDMRRAGESALAQRWPRFAERLRAETPVRAVLSHPLPGLVSRGSINFYSPTPDGFTAASTAPAAGAAALASVAVAAVDARNQADNLTVALTSSRQLGAAIGVIMVQSRCTYDQAFAMIRSVSQRSHRKMRELAEEILFTGALPDADG